MATGSLKFLSLLVVIAAGGGVAWQVQQGILHSPQSETETVTDDDPTTEPDDEATTDPFEGLTDDPPPVAKERSHSNARLTERNTSWAAEEESDISRSDAHQLPSFKRGSRAKLPEEITPVEADSEPALPEELSDANANVRLTGQTEIGDPFDSPSDDKPQEQDEQNPETDDIAAQDSESTAKEDGTVDPFANSSGVMLVGHEEEENEAEKPPRQLPKQLNTDFSDSSAEISPALDDAEDPFANAAPPEFPDDAGEKAASPPEKVATQSESEDLENPLDDLKEAPLAEPETQKPAIKNPFSSDIDDAESPPQKRRSPKGEFETIPARKKPESKEVPSQIDLTSGPVPDDFGSELPETLDDFPKKTSGEKSSRLRSEATEAEVTDSAVESTDSTPRLLPVPEEASPSKSLSRLPSDLDASEKDLPKLGGFTPQEEPRLGTPLTEEELHGDGTPDRDAPQGLQQPRLTIEKKAPKQAVVGQPLVYSVIVRNVGSANANQVTVEDRIPKGTTLVGTSPQAELIDKKLVWRLGTLKPNEEKTIAIKLIPQEQGPIGSVAKVNFVAEIATEIEVTAPQVLLSIESPSQVRLGEKMHMIFRVRNAGGADAHNVVIRNLIPEGLRHPAGADLEYSLGTLASQDSQEIKLDLIPTKNGTVTNTTIITADGGVKVEEETPIEVVGEQLLLTRTGKSRLYVDKPAVFTSTVANEGTAAANRVMVAEVVPAGLEFVSASDNGKYDPATRAVTWSVGPIEPGEELNLSTKLKPKALGDYRATVTVTGPAGSVATVDSNMKVDGYPVVSVESKTDERLISVGEKAIIRIHCRNQGTAPAKNLMLTAELPPQLKLVDCHGPSQWDQQGNLITFESISLLEPGETASFDVEVIGASEGESRLEIQIAADHYPRPLRRDETIHVTPETE